MTYIKCDPMLPNDDSCPLTVQQAIKIPLPGDEVVIAITGAQKYYVLKY